jgi:hypothetical protein
MAYDHHLVLLLWSKYLLYPDEHVPADVLQLYALNRQQYFPSQPSNQELLFQLLSPANREQNN